MPRDLEATLPQHVVGTKSFKYLLVFTTLLSCDDRNPIGMVPHLPSADSPKNYVTNCGVSFTLISSDDDPLMDQYGIGPTADTANVCESWTGNDYIIHVAVVGSSDNMPGATDEVQVAEYQNTLLTAYGSNGAPVGPSANSAGNAFQMARADASQIQASYDDPYYAIRSGGGSCGGLQCNTLQETERRAETQNAGASHPITRKGVRALVEGAEELAGVGTERKFRKTTPEMSLVLTIDPSNELLVGEDVTRGSSSSQTRHFWRRTREGWIRDHSEVTTTEVIHGRRVKSTAVLSFSNVRVSDWGQN